MALTTILTMVVRPVHQNTQNFRKKDALAEESGEKEQGFLHGECKLVDFTAISQNAMQTRIGAAMWLEMENLGLAFCENFQQPAFKKKKV